MLRRGNSVNLSREHLVGANPEHTSDAAVKALVGWMIDHVEIELNYEGISTLDVGDIDVDTHSIPDLRPDGPSWEVVDNNCGLAVTGPSEGDGPYVWTLARDDGPPSSIVVNPVLAEPTKPARDTHGRLSIASGWLIAGSREAIRWWAPRPRDVGAGNSASLADWHYPGPLRHSYGVLVGVPPPGDCTFEVTESKAGFYVAAATIRLPLPPWTPEQSSLLGKSVR